MFSLGKIRNRGGGAGVGLVLPIASITAQQGSIHNRYVAGSGVGASSTFARRAKMYRAATKYDDVAGPTTPTVTRPAAPTGITAVADNGSAIISFNPVAGAVGYRIVSTPGGITSTGTSSPITINGLTNGITYTFTVITNGIYSDSLQSTPSNSVTPSDPVLSENIKAKLISTIYDNPTDGYISFNHIISRMCIDENKNVITASYMRNTNTTINKPDTDGFTQIEVFNENFIGLNSVSQGQATITTYYTYNILITKYNSNGVPLWKSKIGGDTNKGNNIYGIKTDKSNNIYVLVTHGTSLVSYYNSDGTLFGTINNTFSYGNFNGPRYCLIKYNSAGQIQWINTITAGDNNNEYVLNNGGSLNIDSNNNIYISCQFLRAGGGSGPTTVKLYKYSSVNVSNEILFNLITSDSYPFGSEYHRGSLIKIDTSGTYDWVARQSLPTAYGENNGGTINTNIEFDSNNNVYLCLNGKNSSSPICNIYNGTSVLNSPLINTSSLPYYRIDLRGNSLSPSLPQFYVFAAVAKYTPSGQFERLCCAHQLRNASILIDMNPYIGISPSDEIYLAVNAQGYNALNGIINLDTLYVNSFIANVTNGSNYVITVNTTHKLQLTQPQTVLAIIKFNTDLTAERLTYIDTPSGNSGCINIGFDSGNYIYIATSIKDNTTVKTIYTYESITNGFVSTNEYGNINATNSNNDSLLISYNSDLSNVKWVSVVRSSDGLNESGIIIDVDKSNNIYAAGTSYLNALNSINTIDIYDFEQVINSTISLTLAASVDVSNATDKAGFIIKYN